MWTEEEPNKYADIPVTCREMFSYQRVEVRGHLRGVSFLPLFHHFQRSNSGHCGKYLHLLGLTQRNLCFLGGSHVQDKVKNANKDARFLQDTQGMWRRGQSISG